MAVKKEFIIADGFILSSEKWKKNFGPGETIDLSHAKPEEIEALKSLGAIIEKEEVKNG